MGILSKNDLIDADMLTRYGLLNRKLQPYQPEAQEIIDLKSLLNRLDTLERDLRRERNRQEKISKTNTLHRLEKQSMQRTVRYLETEIKRFKKHISLIIESNSSLQRDYELLLTIPGIGARTAWTMLVILGSRRFASAPEVASFLGLNPIEKQSGKTRYRRPRLSKAGNGRFRQSLYFPAMVATRKNPDIKAQYDRLLAAEKSKMCALGAAMRKCRVDDWRGGRSAEPITHAVSSRRSSNRTCGTIASGSLRDHVFAHGKSRVRTDRRTSPKTSSRYSLG